MKASELRPGRFFELNGVRHLLVGHDEDGLQAAVMQYVYRLVPIDPDTEVNANVPQCWEEPPQFKAGDWVVCVQNRYVEGDLSIGAIYQIEELHVDQDDVCIGGLFYHSDRFRHATPAEIEEGQG